MKDAKRGPKGKGKKKYYGKKDSKANNKRSDDSVMDVKGLDNDRGNKPGWYFTDEKLADQVSQMSFQNFAGYPINYTGKDFDVPNIVRIELNPCPGVTPSTTYNSSLIQHTGINMSGFRLYSKLATFTGRVQSYAPQDVSTMLLAYGELISCIEWVRRAFGIAYTMNMRNRDYPRKVLEFGMLIDSNDLFQNLSDYRTRFNTIITMVNQLPIPKNVAYFDKCASLYEKVYLDAPSSMAQTLIPNGSTTWILDEQSYSGGSVLVTTPWVDNVTSIGTLKNLSVYLTTLEAMVSALLNSSSLHIIYTDLMNMASKLGGEFWKFDFLYEDYRVMPEFDPNFMLQMHNATITNRPGVENTFRTSPEHVTPYNDVYPNPNQNALFYNPAFNNFNGVASGSPTTGSDLLIDMLNDSPTVTDRVEVTRYAAMTAGKYFQPTGSSGLTAQIDVTLPDHYIIGVFFEYQTSNLTVHYAMSTLIGNSEFADVSSQVANIDWCPRFWEINTSSGQFTGHYTGDVNFYTTIDAKYLRKLHDFVTLALYDVR